MKNIIINDVFDKNNCKFCEIGEFLTEENENDICNNCGYIRIVYVKERIFDEQYYLNSYLYNLPYTKINHFQKTLACFQGKQVKKIPDALISTIKEKYNENLELEINYKNTRDILKQMKIPKLYDHIFLINKKLGIESFFITDEQEEYLIYQFKQIHGLYFKHSINRDKNSFFNYYYVFYKICQMNNFNQFLPFIPMLKTQSKIDEHEELFESICKELNWKFVSLCDSGCLKENITGI
jgi:hypothetical protein